MQWQKHVLLSHSGVLSKDWDKQKEFEFSHFHVFQNTWQIICAYPGCTVRYGNKFWWHDLASPYLDMANELSSLIHITSWVPAKMSWITAQQCSLLCSTKLKHKPADSACMQSWPTSENEKAPQQVYLLSWEQHIQSWKRMCQCFHQASCAVPYNAKLQAWQHWFCQHQ